MHQLRSAITIATFLFCLSSAYAKDPEIVKFLSADGTTLTGYLIRAIGSEPKSPTVIALHGCGGPLNRKGDKLGSRHRAWAKILSTAGYNVMFPDSFGSRGHKALCKVKPRPVRQRDRVADVEGTLTWLKSQDFADAQAISVLGWSNGGGTALRVARRPFGRELHQVISFYPGCAYMVRNPTPAPATKLKIIMGAADDWTSPVPCQELAKQWNVPIVLYQGAYHSFDTPGRPVRVRSGLTFTQGGKGVAHVGTHYQARRKAIAEVLHTLALE
jgi:dienelactone hydrolase